MDTEKPAPPGLEFLTGGEISELPTAHALNQLLECPVCNEIPIPNQSAIYNCAQGHSICKECRPKLKHCHLCKSEFTDSRNFACENIIRLCRFHCHFKNFGCDQKILGDGLKHHLETCIYRYGPLNEKGKLGVKTSMLHSFYWAETTAAVPVPENSFSGGYDNGHVYVARKLLPNKALVPGSFKVADGKATFVWGDKIFLTKNFEILTAHPDCLEWINVPLGQSVPTQAVIGGKSDIGEVLYIGRKQVEKYHIGFVEGSSRKCTVFISQTEINRSGQPFEVLVKNANGILLESNSNY